MARPVAFAVQVGFMALNNLIFFVFWWMLFERVPRIRGYALGDLAVLFGVVAAGFGLAVSFAGGMRQLARTIDEGELDAFLSQPKPTLLYALGARSQASGVGDLFSGVGLIAFSGRVELVDLPSVAIAVAVSGLVSVASGVLLGSSAFWFGKTDGIARLVFDVLITFALYPDRLFSGLLKILLFTLLPAAFIGTVPARFVQNPSLEGLALLLGSGALYGSIAVWVFYRGLRRYCSGSRFVVAG